MLCYTNSIITRRRAQDVHAPNKQSPESTRVRAPVCHIVIAWCGVSAWELVKWTHTQARAHARRVHIDLPSTWLMATAAGTHIIDQHQNADDYLTDAIRLRERGVAVATI